MGLAGPPDPVARVAPATDTAATAAVRLTAPAVGPWEPAAGLALSVADVPAATVLDRATATAASAKAPVPPSESDAAAVAAVSPNQEAVAKGADSASIWATANVEPAAATLPDSAAAELPAAAPRAARAVMGAMMGAPASAIATAQDSLPPSASTEAARSEAMPAAVTTAAGGTVTARATALGEEDKPVTTVARTMAVAGPGTSCAAEPAPAAVTEPADKAAPAKPPTLAAAASAPTASASRTAAYATPIVPTVAAVALRPASAPWPRADKASATAVGGRNPVAVGVPLPTTSVVTDEAAGDDGSASPSTPDIAPVGAAEAPPFESTASVAAAAVSGTTSPPAPIMGAYVPVQEQQQEQPLRVSKDDGQHGQHGQHRQQ
ncbi:hypothetical protein I4F81_000550 [Pyropia yezoensis]|uniref:Uncharacterized protein n=1 Tax=Pyropia yezoensis TaxID=2788 RepID=A0ACC3BJL9_PYRYE|nr:hypothetical protein I4F81_000550 [Neopyropia yezoensis]